MSGHPLSKREQALLVQLADGTLTGPARARAEARLSRIPDGERLLERQRRVARALGADRKPSVVREPRALRLVAAGALATALVLMWVLAPGGDRTTTERAADMAQLPATRPAPAASGAVLRAEVDGVRFPDWGPEFGWHETGLRRDTIDGRRTATVYYEHMGHRLAYTIVSGPALPRPANAHVVRRDGLAISLVSGPGPRRPRRRRVRARRPDLRGGRARPAGGHAAQARRLEGRREHPLLTE